jgi:hypothetical protein
MKSQGGGQTDDPFGELIGSFDKRDMLGAGEAGRGVETPVDFLEKTFLDQAAEVVPRNAKLVGVLGTNDLPFGGEPKEFVSGRFAHIKPARIVAKTR